MVPRDNTNWIQTVSGRQFFPLDPRPEDVFIHDIAHGLSNMARFNGHTREFYSVAQHSVLVSLIVPEEDALEGLLHDATEAYLADITRPVKPHLANYCEIEDHLMSVIAQRFGIRFPFPKSVKQADNTILNTEKRDLMGPSPAQWDRSYTVTPMSKRIVALPPREARALFLHRYHQLVPRVSSGTALTENCLP